MSEITTIRFDGDNLQTVREGEAVWVVVKRVCEALGVDRNGQQQRLQDAERAPWAVGCMMHLTGSDGKTYEMFCVDLDTLPMWLATIDVGRVKPEAREKLIAYQKECARVLRDHFFGRQSSIDVAAVVAAITQMANGLTAIGAHLDCIDARLSALETAQATAGFITSAAHRQIRGKIASIAQARRVVGDARSVPAARASIYQRLRKAYGWGGPGQPWDRLPANLAPHVESYLAEMRKDVDEKLARMTREERQTGFGFTAVPRKDN